MSALDTYLSLMSTVRSRLDVIQLLRVGPGTEFVRAESAAFHGRKVLEAIAFACLVAIDNSFQTIPRDARGQWNAEDILKRLQRKDLNVLPSPSIIRPATADEQRDQNVTVVIEGIPERRLTHTELIQMYQRLHAWLHEVNPYTTPSQEVFCAQRAPQLWDDLSRLRSFIDKHVMSIQNAGFFCVLDDNNDHLTKVSPISLPAPNVAR